MAAAAASTKIVAVVVAVLLAILEMPSCAVARRHHHDHHDKPGHHDGGFPAVMTVNGFEKGEDGGPAACDGHYHSDGELIVALSTEWFAGGRRYRS
uniref:Uncharacterized protein n=1 Tax=Oryza barthii TaxID=65489 RepID=A0A0D3HF07_9ORYZ